MALLLAYLFHSAAHHYYYRYQLTALQLAPELESIQPRWALERLPEERLAQLLAQPFDYLGSGAQSVAFVSRDGRWVLKLLHYKLVNPPPWLFLVERLRWNKRRTSRLDELRNQFEAYRLVAAASPELAGIVHLDFRLGDAPHRLVSVYDRMGFHHRLDLSRLSWLLQERLVAAEGRIRQQLIDGETEAANSSLAAIDQLIVKEGQLGLYDRDKGMIHNTGFDPQGQLRHFDIGCLLPLPEGAEGEKLLAEHRSAVAERLRRWLKEKAPQGHQRLRRDNSL